MQKHHKNNLTPTNSVKQLKQSLSKWYTQIRFNPGNITTCQHAGSREEVRQHVVSPEEVRLLKHLLHEVHSYLSPEVGRQLIKELSLLPVSVPHPHLSIVVPVLKEEQN